MLLSQTQNHTKPQDPHDIEMIHNVSSTTSHAQSMYKQAYLKYQSEAHNRQYSLPLRSRGEISYGSPSIYTQRNKLMKTTGLSLSMVGMLPHHQSVLVTNLSGAPGTNIKLPDYKSKNKEYIKRDFSPYIKSFLQQYQLQVQKGSPVSNKYQKYLRIPRGLMQQKLFNPKAIKNYPQYPYNSSFYNA